MKINIKIISILLINVCFSLVNATGLTIKYDGSLNDEKYIHLCITPIYSSVFPGACIRTLVTIDIKNKKQITYNKGSIVNYKPNQTCYTYERKPYYKDLNISKDTIIYNENWLSCTINTVDYIINNNPINPFPFTEECTKQMPPSNTVQLSKNVFKAEEVIIHEDSSYTLK